MANQQEERTRALATIDAWAGAVEQGVPHDLFVFLTRIVPIINVDLLIRDDRLGTLLTWRDDEYYGPGWHLPGGVIRYKETFDARIRLTARRELGAEVSFEPEPIAVIQAIQPMRRERGHFISLLYRCRLLGPLHEGQRHNPADPRPEQWAWHLACPQDLIPEQEPYRRFL